MILTLLCIYIFTMNVNKIDLIVNECEQIWFRRNWRYEWWNIEKSMNSVWDLGSKFINVINVISMMYVEYEYV